MNHHDLCYACEYGDASGVEYLLAKGDIDINGKDINGRTPLINAMMCHYTDIVKTLLANPNTRLDIPTFRGMGALHLAWFMDLVECVKLYTSDST